MNYRRSVLKITSLLITLILVPLISAATQDSSIKDLGTFSVPHPDGNPDYGWESTRRGIKVGFLVHQCLEGREIVSIQSAPKNPNKAVLLATISGLRDESGQSIVCEQENWFVIESKRLEISYGKRIGVPGTRLVCVRNNLLMVHHFAELVNLGVSKGSNRCSEG